MKFHIIMREISAKEGSISVPIEWEGRRRQVFISNEVIDLVLDLDPHCSPESRRNALSLNFGPFERGLERKLRSNPELDEEGNLELVREDVAFVAR